MDVRIGGAVAALVGGLIGGAVVAIASDGGAPGGAVAPVTEAPAVVRGDERALDDLRGALARLEARVTELEASGATAPVQLSFDDLPREDLAALRAELRAAVEELRDATPAAVDVAVEVEALAAARDALDGRGGSADERVDALARHLDLDAVQRDALVRLEADRAERRSELQRRWFGGESLSSIEPLAEQLEADVLRGIEALLRDDQRDAWERLVDG